MLMHKINACVNAVTEINALTALVTIHMNLLELYFWMNDVNSISVMPCLAFYFHLTRSNIMTMTVIKEHLINELKQKLANSA